MEPQDMPDVYYLPTVGLGQGARLTCGDPPPASAQHGAEARRMAAAAQAEVCAGGAFFFCSTGEWCVPAEMLGWLRCWQRTCVRSPPCACAGLRVAPGHPPARAQ